MHVVSLLKFRRNAEIESDDEIQMIAMSSVYLKFMHDFLNIIMLCLRYIQMKKGEKKRKKLMKPHVVIKLLRNYRSFNMLFILRIYPGLVVLNWLLCLYYYYTDFNG